jgi:hypothetical protein
LSELLFKKAKTKTMMNLSQNLLKRKLIGRWQMIHRLEFYTAMKMSLLPFHHHGYLKKKDLFKKKIQTSVPPKKKKTPKKR